MASVQSMRKMMLQNAPMDIILPLCLMSAKNVPPPVKLALVSHRYALLALKILSWIKVIALICAKFQMKMNGAKL